MAHARHVVESWDDDDDAFALPSDDLNPLRISSVNSSVAYADGEDDGFTDEDDFHFEVPQRTDWARLGEGSGSGGHGLDRWMEDGGGEDDRSATIKASAGGTLKLPGAAGGAGGMRTITSLDQVASLAIPVPTTTVPGSSRHGLSAKLSTISLAKSFTLPSASGAEAEDDFALPDSLSHLSLRPLRTQNSSASFASSTSTSAHAASAWGDGPSSAHSNVPSLVKDGSEAATSSDVGDHDFLPDDGPFGAANDDDEAEAFGLDGIVLPDPLFFTRANSTLYLKTLLEAKSKGSSATPAAAPVRGQQLKRASDTVRIVSGRDTSSAVEDSFEAGLELDDGSAHLLSAARLKTVKARTAARARTLPLPKGARPKPAGALTLPGKKADDDWTKELERGWRRPKSPLPPANGATSAAAGRHPRTGSNDSATPSASSAAKIGKGRPSTQSRSSAPSLVAPSTSPSALRRERSQARLDAPGPSSSSPPPVPSPASSPVLARYAGTGAYAQGLLNRKASLPHLSLDSTDDFRSASPSNQLGRFAAPTASSLARKRERNAERSAIVSQELYSPPSAPRSATPQLTFSPSAVIGSRLTMPTSSSRQKARAPISHSTFATASHSPSPAGSHGGHHRPAGSAASSATAGPRAPAIQTRPKGARRYGDGTELDALEDLNVDAEKERQFRVPEKADATRRVKDLKAFPSMAQILHSRASSPVAPLGGPRSRNQSTLTAGTASSEMKRKKALSSTSASSVALAADGVQRKPKKRPALKIIKNLGSADQAKVQGGMTYNPKTFRWEGNESALQAFEPALASARPALITHFTGTSVSSLGGGLGSPLHGPSSAKSPSAAISARVVGHMQFDPVKMCWISLLGKDDEEPDPFADMDDDVDMADLGVSAAGRPPSRSSATRSRRDPSYHGSMDVDAFDATPAPPPRPPVSLAEYIRRGPDEFDLGRRCRLAEEGHRAEIAQWALGTSAGGRGWREKERGRLWEIRRVALRAERDDRLARSTATNDSTSTSTPTTTGRARP